MVNSLGVSSKGETVGPAFPVNRFLLDPLSPAGLESASLRRAPPPPSARRAAGWGLLVVVGGSCFSSTWGPSLSLQRPPAVAPSPAATRHLAPLTAAGAGAVAESARARGGGGEPGWWRTEPDPASCASSLRLEPKNRKTSRGPFQTPAGEPLAGIALQPGHKGAVCRASSSDPVLFFFFPLTSIRFPLVLLFT